MKRVLVVSRVFPPFRSVGHSIRMVKFIKYLPALGWLPSVLTIEDKQEYEADRKQGSETLLGEIPAEVSIHRTAAGEPSSKVLEKKETFRQRNWLTGAIVKMLGRARRWGLRHLLLPDQALLWFPFALKRGRQVVSREQIDVILATCPPYSTTLVGAFLKLVTGKRLILDFRDDWIDTPWYHSMPPIARMVNRVMEGLVVRVADKVILVTEWSRQAFLKRYSTQASEKFVLVPNGCDLGEFTPLPWSVAARPNRRFTILHAGTLNVSKQWTRTPAPLLEALHLIVKRDPWLVDELNLAFTGFLAADQKQLVKDLELSAVVTELGFLPRDEFIRLMHECDLLVVINYEGWATLIPGKLYEYWAIGGPPILLVSCRGAAASLVERHGLGITVEPSDVTGIEDAILTVYRQKEAGAPIRINTVGIERYDRKALTSELALLLSKVSGSQS